ncbi:MAG: hypothetical protein ABFD82_08480 [Syntrophaceae bacterium]
MAEIMWYCRETVRSTKKTNINLYIVRNRSTRLKNPISPRAADGSG